MAYLRFKKLDHSDPITICKLIFTPDKRSFQPGEIIQGLLIVSLTAKRELSFHGFKVAMEGTSLTKYNERRESVESRTEVFLEMHKYVYGKEPPQENSNQIGMAAGVHKFPFSFRIPVGVPGSFTSPFGTISFQIVAYIHMSRNRILRKTEKGFEVKSRLDLESPVLLTPIDTVEVVGGDAQNIKLTFRTPQSGYLAGEEIPFGIELENPNTLEIASVSLALVQKCLYHPTNPRRSTKTATVISNLETRDMDGCYGAVWTWTDGLPIPLGTKTTYDKGIIQIHYCLKVEVMLVTQVESPGSLSMEVPILIGTSAGVGGGATQINSQAMRRHSISPIPSTSKQFLQKDDEISADLVALSVGENKNDVRGRKERPPSYSTLRTRSKSSENSPPAYDAAASLVVPDELPMPTPGSSKGCKIFRN